MSEKDWAFYAHRVNVLLAAGVWTRLEVVETAIKGYRLTLENGKGIPNAQGTGDNLTSAYRDLFVGHGEYDYHSVIRIIGDRHGESIDAYEGARDDAEFWGDALTVAESGALESE